MKIYEEKDEGKRTFQCSHCWNNGHNKRACSQLKAHYLANKDCGEYMTYTGVTKEMFSLTVFEDIEISVGAEFIYFSAANEYLFGVILFTPEDRLRGPPLLLVVRFPP